MKLNINEIQILKLILDNLIELDNIEPIDREKFIKNNADIILLESFKNKNFKQLEILFENKQIQDVFVNKIKQFNSLAELNYIEQLPENNIISYFILEMTRQNYEEKEVFFNKLVPIILNNKKEMTEFFSIKTGTAQAGFIKGSPIGFFILRVINTQIEKLLEEKIISTDLYNLISQDTLVHSLHQYSFENSKIIIEQLTDVNVALKDKNNVGHNPIDKLSSDLRERNVKTIEYLFSEKLDMALYKKELIDYIVKSSNILKNKQTKPSLRQRAFDSLNVIFNLPQLQSNENLKESIAKNLAHKCTPEVQYLWLSAKMPNKGDNIKRPKI